MHNTESQRTNNSSANEKFTPDDLYFIDYRVVSLPRWVRVSMADIDTARRYTLEALSSKDFRELRISRECDLSELVIAEDGTCVTRRELQFGRQYQEWYEEISSNPGELRALMISRHDRQ